MTKDLLIKFLNDNYSEDELKEIVRWLKENPFDIEQRNVIKQVWDSFSPGKSLPDDKKFDSILDRIHHKINIKNQQSLRVNRTAQIQIWLTRAAAFLLVPVLGIFLYVLTQRPVSDIYHAELMVDSIEIVTPVGAQTVVQLSDGSEVYLNHGSKLFYPHKFIGNTREVRLEGEGYFNVSHNPERPFIVKTKNLNVRAIGTSFNVFAYPNENFVSATLVEGKVILEKILKNNIKETIGGMVPGQHVSYDIDDDKVSSTKGDIYEHISWKDGKLVFKNESIIQITRRLSRWYNVEFEFADETSKEYTYTATFVDETLEQILSLLKIATPISYNKIPRQQLPDGTFTKQKIVIEKK